MGPGLALSPRYFDINWDRLRADLEGRVLLPGARRPVRRDPESGEITLASTPKRRAASAPGITTIVFRSRRGPTRRSSPRGGGALAGFASEFAGLGKLAGAGGSGSGRRSSAGTRASGATNLRSPMRSRPPCIASPGSPATPTAFCRCTSCSKPRPTGSRIGGLPRRKSITAASSTSTTSPGCAWKSPSCSRRPTACSSPWSSAAMFRGCASTISTGCSTRTAIASVCSSDSDAPLYVLVEKILAPTKHCPIGRSPAPPATISPTRCWRSLSIPPARRR